MYSNKYKFFIAGLVLNLILASLTGITLLYGLKWVDKSYTLVIDQESKRLNYVSDLSMLIVNGQVYILNYYNPNTTQTMNPNNYTALVNEISLLINKLNKDTKDPSEKVLIMNTNKTFNEYSKTVESIIQNKEQMQLEKLEEVYQKTIVACDKLKNYYITEIDKTNQYNTKISNLVIGTCLTIIILTQAFNLILLFLNKKKRNN